MTSQNYTELLLEKIKALSPEKFSEVEDFVDFLSNRTKHTNAREEERLRIAIDAGLITPPEPDQKPSSVTDTPPVCIPGRPLSEIIIEDRR